MRNPRDKNTHFIITIKAALRIKLYIRVRITKNVAHVCDEYVARALKVILFRETGNKCTPSLRFGMFDRSIRPFENDRNWTGPSSRVTLGAIIRGANTRSETPSRRRHVASRLQHIRARNVSVIFRRITAKDISSFSRNIFHPGSLPGDLPTSTCYARRG